MNPLRIASVIISFESFRKALLLNIITWIGLSIPLLSIASIFTSVVTRKRGKSKFSFAIQFLPMLVFAVMLILMFFWDRA